MKRGYVDTPDGQIHYRTEGSGPALLLLHQVPLSSREYIEVIPFLSKDYRCVAMDSLGCGESDRPERVLQIADYAKNVTDFLDALKIDKASIVGDHMGAHIALETAVTYPERVEKLFFSGLPCTNSRAVTPNYEHDWRPLEITEDGAHLMEVWNSEQVKLGRTPEIWLQNFLDMLRHGKRAHEGHWVSSAYDPRPKLPLVKCPVCLMSGREDIFLSMVEDEKKLIPHSNVDTPIIEGPWSSGEIVSNMPKEVAEAILKFLKKPFK